MNAELYALLYKFTSRLFDTGLMSVMSVPRSKIDCTKGMDASKRLV
jgi:hypothetical protein